MNGNGIVNETIKTLSKHKNKIIITILVIAVVALVIRWFVVKKRNGNEGFINLSLDDDILSRTETSSVSYLWDNNLYLAQYPANDPPENLVVISEPKLVSSNNNVSSERFKLGSIINNKIDTKTNNDIKSIMVGKDVVKPAELTEIISINEISNNTGTSHQLVTMETINNDMERNNTLLNNLLTTDIEDIFNQIVNAYSDMIQVKLYRDYFTANDNEGTTGIFTNVNGVLTYDFSGMQVNAMKIPVGSTVELTFADGTTKTFTLPAGNILSNNGELIKNINYQQLLKGSGINEDTFNPFGKHGLGFKQGGNNNALLSGNNGVKYPYNYGIGDTNSVFGLIQKSSLYNYLLSDKIKSSDNKADYGDKYQVRYFDNAIYFVDNISKVIPASIVKLTANIPETKDIERYIVNVNNGDYKTKCQMGSKGRNCDGKSIMIGYTNDGCIKSWYKGICVNNDNTPFVVTDATNDLKQFTVVKEGIYINRLWNIDTTGYTNIDFTGSTDTFAVEITYCNPMNYTEEIMERLNIPCTTTDSNVSINNITGYNDGYNSIARYNSARNITNMFFMLNEKDYANVFKRNALTCLWNDGYIIIENVILNDENKYQEYPHAFHNMKVGENSSENMTHTPWIKYKFVNKEHAKMFVANIINRLDKRFSKSSRDTVNSDNTKQYIRTPTIIQDFNSSIDIVNMKSKNGNTITDISTKLSELINRYNAYVDVSSQLTDEGVNAIIEELNSLTDANNYGIYYLNTAFTLPVYTYDKIKNEVIESKRVSLFDGSDNGRVVTRGKVILPIDSNPAIMTITGLFTKFKNTLQTFTDTIVKSNESYKTVIDIINNKQLKHYPLTIYRPIAPTGYRNLGDIVSTENYNAKEHIHTYGCVPEQCVKGVRPWLSSDKIYEYDTNDQYFALYRNPYLNTFRCVKMRNTIPDGEVEKVVACVSKCKIVDNLIHSDKCASEYKKSYQAVVNENNLDRNKVLYKEQEDALKNMLANRQEEIEKLKKRINSVEYEDQRAHIVNHAKNRAEFLKLLDTQQYNMYKLIKSLYSIISIKVNTKELADRLQAYGIDENVISNIMVTIGEISQDNTNVGNNIGTTANNNEANAEITEPAKLQRIIYEMRDGNQQNMVLRALVESSCGCYFTDEELLN